MTPDELRGMAQEQYDRMCKENDPFNGDDWAVVQVLRAFLAEHLADDGENITEPWLQSVGFKILPRSTRIHEIEGGKHKGLNFCPKWIDPNKEPGAGDWGIGLFGEYGGYLIREPFIPKTRGAVRQLCAALGIPLTEPGVK